MIGAFVLFDLPGAEVFAAVLTYRLIAFWLPIPPGIVAFLQLRKTVARWEAPSEGRRRAAATAAARRSRAPGRPLLQKVKYNALEAKRNGPETRRSNVNEKRVENVIIVGGACAGYTAAALHRPRQPRAARDRGLPVGRPAPEHHRRRELPRLPRGDHGARADASSAPRRSASGPGSSATTRPGSSSPTAASSASGSATTSTWRRPSSSPWARSRSGSASRARSSSAAAASRPAASATAPSSRARRWSWSAAATRRWRTRSSSPSSPTS